MPVCGSPLTTLKPLDALLEEKPHFCLSTFNYPALSPLHPYPLCSSLVFPLALPCPHDLLTQRPRQRSTPSPPELPRTLMWQLPLGRLPLVLREMDVISRHHSQHLCL